MHNYGFKIFWSETDKAFIATCPEFSGLSAFGDTADEALREAQVALELFVEEMQESGEPLPVPQPAHTYSGQFRARLPRSLHRQLAERAEEEGVSLNTLVVSYVASGVARVTKKETLTVRPEPQFARAFVEGFARSQPLINSLRPAMISTSFDRAPVDEIKSKDCEAINYFSSVGFDQSSIIEELAGVS